MVAVALVAYFESEGLPDWFSAIGKTINTHNSCIRFVARFLFQAVSLAVGEVAQHSVQPIGGSRRVFKPFAWLRVCLAPKPNLVPPTSG